MTECDAIPATSGQNQHFPVFEGSDQNHRENEAWPIKSHENLPRNSNLEVITSSAHHQIVSGDRYEDDHLPRHRVRRSRGGLRWVFDVKFWRRCDVKIDGVVTFADYITQEERLPEEVARKMFYQVLTAIEYCHKNNVVHRDLKVSRRRAMLQASTELATKCSFFIPGRKSPPRSKRQHQTCRWRQMHFAGNS